MNYDWELIKSTTRALQKDKRYKHTIGVANEVLSLGKIFLPKKLDKLYLAGLLHDITKDFDKEEQLKLCEKYGIELSENIPPKLLHAKTGANFAKEKFGTEYVDSEVFSGIFYHTTGRANMNIFEMLIYLADYIEDGRTFEDCVVLRKFFYDKIRLSKTTEEKLEVLRKTMLFSFDLTIKNLIDEGKMIDTDTIESRNYFLTTKLQMEE